MEGVAEGDHLLPARVDDVGGVPRAVARGEPDVDAGEDLLALGHGAHLRRQGLDHVAHALRFGVVTLGPLGFGDQVVDVGEGGPVAAGGGMPGPPEVVGVQVGDLGDHAEVVDPGQCLLAGHAPGLGTGDHHIDRLCASCWQPVAAVRARSSMNRTARRAPPRRGRSAAGRC